MLRREKVAQVERLLAQGNISQRGVARIAQVSRGSVRTILLGRHPHQLAINAPFEDRPIGPIERCKCGALVEKPCRICEALAYRNLYTIQRLRMARAEPPEEPAQISLDLAGDDRTRYETIRSSHIEQPDAA